MKMEWKEGDIVLYSIKEKHSFRFPGDNDVKLGHIYTIGKQHGNAGWICLKEFPQYGYESQYFINLTQTKLTDRMIKFFKVLSDA